MAEIYKNWLGNQKVIENLKESVKKSGTPLELRTKKFLKDNNFYATNIHYLSDNIWRELDIRAFRIEKLETEIEGCKIVIMTHILGECKYSTDMDVFVFEHLDKENVDTKLFPIRVNGQKILSPFVNSHFKFPLIIEKAINVNVSILNKTNGNYTDSRIHDACEQVLAAVSSYCDRQRKSICNEYNNFTRGSTIFSLWKKEPKSENVEREKISGGIEAVPDNIIDDFLREKFNSNPMLRDFPYIIIHLIIPLVVFDENRGLIKACVDENCNITDFEDVGFCLYPYISENANKYQNVLENHFNFPIILSSYNCLDKILKIIDKGIEGIINEMKEDIIQKPYLIPKEIIFNDNIYS